MDGEPTKDSAGWESSARDLWEQSPAHVAVFHGPEHRVAFVNRAFTGAFGDGPSHGLTAMAAFPALRAGTFFEALDAVLASGEARAGGRQRWVAAASAGEPASERFVDFTHHPLHGRDGAVAGVFV